MSTTPISDVMILAAIERAVLHRGRSGAPIWLVFEHLGLPRRARRVRPQLQMLVEGGALARSRRHGVELLNLTTAGHRQLRRAGQVELPESPQHREWRAARTLAEQEVERFRSMMADVLKEAAGLLDGSGSSDAWFEIGDRLTRAAWRLGSATYCLWEWAEPKDDRADIDDRSMPGDEYIDDAELARRRNRRAGRRNTLRWRDDE